MNRQDVVKNGKATRGIEWTQPYGRPGYTSNPIWGCKHDCQWQMPNGEWAICYADRTAQAFMPDRPFNQLTFHPEEFGKWKSLQEPAGIFIGSMSDVFGATVPDEWVQETLKHVAENPQHIFFTLTKNAQRLRKYQPYPKNLWVGASVPPTRMFKKTLATVSQMNMLSTTLRILSELDAQTTWMSFEPLSWDVAPLVRSTPNLRLSWAVIGAASIGAKVFQPKPEWVLGLMNALGICKIPVFFKGNLKGNAAADPWREEYPDES